MKNSHKILIAVFGTILVLSVALGVVGFILGLQESRDREDTNGIPAEIVDAFQNKLVSRGVEKQGQPIEGFDAFLLMQAFTGLHEEDFDGVLAFEGVYRYEGGQLVYERLVTQPITSAERTVSNKGYGILLENLSERLGLSIQDEQAAVGLVDTLEETVELPPSGRPTPTPTPTSIPTSHPAPEGEEIILQEGQRESSFLLQNIYSDYVEGLNFGEYPLPTDGGYPVTLRVGEIVSNGCTVQLTLIRIEGDKAVFTKKTDFNRPCPICLAENTLIDTPSGGVAVQKLQTGDLVWTVNVAGERIATIVLKTAKTPVPATHQMVHIVLADGREFFASPKHPTADGRTMDELVLGDVLDGSSITSVALIPYARGYTYDILPSGETGFYWANGILFGTTLR